MAAYSGICIPNPLAATSHGLCYDDRWSSSMLGDLSNWMLAQLKSAGSDLSSFPPSHGFCCHNIVMFQPANGCQYCFFALPFSPMSYMSTQSCSPQYLFQLHYTDVNNLVNAKSHVATLSCFPLLSLFRIDPKNGFIEANLLLVCL